MFKIHRLPSWAKFCYETCSCIEENDPNIAISKKRALIAVSQAEKGKRSTSLMICSTCLLATSRQTGQVKPRQNILSFVVLKLPAHQICHCLQIIYTVAFSVSCSSVQCQLRRPWR
ncbi:hypothetical protein M513_04093 [Trichuris suis]|uniref:Uncharacterized protein n=1 Tax=Trichuris suis TaxID=68888 RepID=A0A085MCG5_9BILA|nr:hypothetical protein M513_04093 [Trichuris suis]